MDPRSPNHRNWLEAEQSGRDDTAEAAFAQLFAELPAVEPDTDFVSRTVRVAWRARARRGLATRLARVAAAVLVAAAGVALLYVSGVLVVSAAVQSALLFSHALVWLVTSIGEGARWWSIAGRVGAAVGQTISAPQITAAVAIVELIGAAAIYALQRTLHDERGTNGSQKVQA